VDARPAAPDRPGPAVFIDLRGTVNDVGRVDEVHDVGRVDEVHDVDPQGKEWMSFEIAHEPNR
jgi:hypothetical protein